MVVRCVTAVTLLNKKCVKCTTLSIAAKALGAELKRACHGDSHSQRGKMASACWLHQVAGYLGYKNTDLFPPVALVRLRSSCAVVELLPESRATCPSQIRAAAVSLEFQREAPK